MSAGLSFEVRGTPAPQGSKRHVGRGILVESAGPRLKAWRDAVRVDCVHAMTDTGCPGWPTGPVRVVCLFLMPRPKSHYRTGKHADQLRPDAPAWHDQTPDGDKVLRATLDALVAAGIVGDDRQFASFVVDQIWANRHPGAIVTVSPLATLPHVVAYDFEVSAPTP